MQHLYTRVGRQPIDVMVPKRASRLWPRYYVSTTWGTRVNGYGANPKHAIESALQLAHGSDQGGAL